MHFESFIWTKAVICLFALYVSIQKHFDAYLILVIYFPSIDKINKLFNRKSFQNPALTLCCKSTKWMANLPTDFFNTPVSHSEVLHRMTVRLHGFVSG